MPPKAREREVASEEDGSDDDEGYAAFNRDYFGRAFEHEKMLGDKRRMDFYNAIIRDAVAACASPPTVLDVGTGTGVLAAWAEKAGAKQVYAFDHSERTLEFAATLAEANGCRRIAFMCGHSTQFDVDTPIDIIVHEQLGDVLFDEHVVRTIVDLRDRVLSKPGGKIVPSQLQLIVGQPS